MRRQRERKVVLQSDDARELVQEPGIDAGLARELIDIGLAAEGGEGRRISSGRTLG